MAENFQEKSREEQSLPPLANLQTGAKELARLIERKQIAEAEERLKKDYTCLSDGDFRQMVSMINDVLKKDAQSLNTTLPHLEINPGQYVFNLNLVSPGKIFGSSWPNKHDLLSGRSFDKWLASDYDDIRDAFISQKSCAAIDKNSCNFYKQTYSRALQLPIELRLE
jgi:hypothetical protein